MNLFQNNQWKKYEGNPVLGGELGVCFDICVLRDNGNYRMYFSWRNKKSIALAESADGIHWGEPVICIAPKGSTGWEDDINRPIVLKQNGVYHMWYTGQAKGTSAIGYAKSLDGYLWEERLEQPVLTAEAPWEKVAVMCPHVLWNEENKTYKMWYSAGDQYEPDAIGYAESSDSIHWRKHPNNPVMQADKTLSWEQHKVTACQVIHRDEWFYMLYIGFADEHHAQIGLARSHDGICGWERYDKNPIIVPDPDAWDGDACYKPFALFDGEKWLLWYNGRRGHVEQIGLAIFNGSNFWR